MFSEFITVTGDTSKLKISIHYPNCESGENPPYFILRIFHKAERYRYYTRSYIANKDCYSFTINDSENDDKIVATIYLNDTGILKEYNMYSGFYNRDKETEEFVFIKQNVKKSKEVIVNE